MDIKIFLQLERRNLLRNILAIDKKIKALPAGSLSFERNGRYWKWRRIFFEDAVPSVALSKTERSLAEGLALKRYYLDRRKGMMTQINQIDHFLSEYRSLIQYPDALDERCPDYQALLASCFARQEAFRQQCLMPDSSGGASHPENLIHPTKCGILVRSKSEAVIADALYSHGLAFRYEMQLDLGGMTVHPDFAIQQEDDPELLTLWEHFGRMDNDDYAQTNLMKIPHLIAAGFIPGKNLILTFESRDTPLDINLVELLIGYYFL